LIFVSVSIISKIRDANGNTELMVKNLCSSLTRKKSRFRIIFKTLTPLTNTLKGNCKFIIRHTHGVYLGFIITKYRITLDDISKRKVE